MENPDSIVDTLNLSKICRVCLLELDAMYSLFSSVPQNELNITPEPTYIYEMLTSISSIKVLVDDSLPLLICTNCLELAQATYNFQQQCNRSQELLETYLLQLQSNPCEEFSDVIDKDVEHDSETEEVLEFIKTNLLNNEDFLGLDDAVLKPDIPEQEKVEVIEEKPLIVEVEETVKDEKKPKTNFKVESKKTAFLDYIVEKSFDCHECGKKYKHINSLRTHLRSHKLERVYECSYCKKSFTQFRALKYHLRGHTGEQPYGCDVCGKRYRQVGSLTAHKRVHTEKNKPFLCSVCGSGFRRAPDLGYHMRTHTQERPYMCTICGKTMRMQGHLVQHMRIHTGEKPFQCDQCDKAFPSSTRLKRHEIIHTGLKPFTCEVCSKAFNRASSLKLHAKIHTDERPFVCSICNKAFLHTHALKSHLNRHLMADALDVINQIENNDC